MELSKPQETIIPASVRAKTPRPAEMMITIEVETDCSNLGIDGWTVSVGKSRVTVPVSMLPRVHALVETRHERLAKAKVNYDFLVSESVAKGRKVDTLPYSVQAEFRKLADLGEKQRDMLPLKSCVEIGEPFMRNADGAEQQGALMLGMAGAIAKAMAAENGDIDKRIADAVSKALAAERAARKG
jgi:hypothetical protein